MARRCDRGRRWSVPARQCPNRARRGWQALEYFGQGGLADLVLMDRWVRECGQPGATLRR
jgi:hypothetical protein